MRSRRCALRASLAWGGAIVFVLSGCAGSAPVSDADQSVIDQLGAIAARDAEIDGSQSERLTGVECWQPSAHTFSGTRFRVLCRVHYEQADAGRFRDMICVGDARDDPVSDYCYEWAPYSDMPVFEDQPAYSAL